MIKPAMDSDSDLGQQVAQRLTATRTPFLTSVVVELSYCLLLTQWLADDTTHVESPLLHITVDRIVEAKGCEAMRMVSGRCPGAPSWSPCWAVFSASAIRSRPATAAVSRSPGEIESRVEI